MNNRKSQCIIILLIIGCSLKNYSQFSYSFKRKDIEVERYQNKKMSPFVLERYVRILDILFKEDQKVRKKALAHEYENGNRAIVNIDSLNFYTLSLFFKKYGIPSLNKLNIPNDSMRFVFDDKRGTLFLHLIEEYHDTFFHYMEESVLKGVADMSSLQDITIQYLFRLNEFKFSNKYRVIGLPNITDKFFGKFYMRAIIDFIKHYFIIAMPSEKEYLICKNPFNGDPMELVSNETLLVNKQLREQGLNYQISIEKIVFFIYSNFFLLKENFSKYSSSYLLIIFSNPNKRSVLLQNFK